MLIPSVNLSFYGDGPPVVLIPGFASMANSWAFQYRWLKKFFKIIVVENKGADPLSPDNSYDIDVIASEINNAIEKHGIGKVALIGSSMGAMIALEFAQQHPERIGSLILTSLPVENSAMIKYLNEDLKQSMPLSADLEEFFKKILPLYFSSGFIQKHHFNLFADFFLKNSVNFSKDVLYAQLAAMIKWLEAERWTGGCRCPCLFVFGSDDVFIKENNIINRINRVFAPAEVKIINDAGHAVHIEKYTEFSEIVYDFLIRNNH